MDSRIDPQWWSKIFNETYLDLYDSLLTPERSEAEVESIISTFSIQPPVRVLDVACGQGRHAIAFARRGFEVVGVDLSMHLLEVAAARTDEAGLTIEYVQADMRELPFSKEFDLVVNLYTAYGYFEEEWEHQRALAAFSRALQPGGRLVLETINRDGQLRVLSPITWSKLPNGILTLEHHRFDPYDGRLLTEQSLHRPGQEPNHHNTSLRLFASEDLVRLFKSECLEDVRLFEGFSEQEAGFSGSLRPYTMDSIRICITGCKPR